MAAFWPATAEPISVKHAGGEAEIGGDRIEMPGPGAGAGSDQQLVVLAGGQDLLDQGVDGRPAPVDHALPADLDDGGVGKDPVVGRRVGRPQELLVGQGPFHQEGFEFRHLVRPCTPLRSGEPGHASAQELTL